MAIESQWRHQAVASSRRLGILVGIALLGFMLSLFLAVSGLPGMILLVGLCVALLTILNPMAGIFVLLVLVNPFLPEYLGVDLGAGLPAFNVADCFILFLLAGTVLACFVKRENLFNHLVLFFLVLYILAGAVSLIGSIYSNLVPSKAARFNFVLLGRLYIMPTILLFAALHLIRKKETVYRMFDLLVFTGAATSVYGIFTILGGHNPLYPSTDVIEVFAAGQSEYEATYAWFLARNCGTFSQPIHFGCFLALLIPYNLVRVTQTTTRKERLYFMVTLYLNLIGVATCLSRGPWLAVLVTVPFLLGNARVRNILFIMSLLVVLIAPLGILSSPDLATTLDTLKERFTGLDTLRARMVLQYMCLRLWVTKPIFGVGLGNYSILYPRLWERLNAQPEDFGLVAAYFVEKTVAPHNIYTYLLCETGLFGLTSFASILFLTFRAAWTTLRRLRGEDREEYYRIFSIALGCVSLLVAGLTYDVLWLSRVSVYFWFLIGVLVLTPRLYPARFVPIPAPSSETRSE